MKQIKTFLVLAAFLLALAGCMNDAQEKNEEAEPNEGAFEENKLEEKADEETSEEENPSENETTTSNYEIRLNEESKQVELVDPDQKVTVLSEQSASEPVISNDKSKAVYISPNEWEMAGSLYLVNLETGKQEELIPTENDLKPKNVIWHDNNHLFVIIGYVNGTVAVGGDIYSVNIDTKEKVQITNNEEQIQITDFHIDNNTLYYEGIRYIDDIMNEHEEYSNEISLETIEQQLEKWEKNASLTLTPKIEFVSETGSDLTDKWTSDDYKKAQSLNRAHRKMQRRFSWNLLCIFFQMMAAKMGWERYGDVNYIEHVLRYYHSEDGSVVVVGDGTQRFDVEEVHNIMKEFLGLPYVWGGRTPAAGGFDCSGLLEYAFAQVGIDLYGTAQSQYNKTVPVPEDQIKPGDLVFFSTYKPGASHVGMYVGDGKFINSNGGKGTSYSSV